MSRKSRTHAEDRRTFLKKLAAAGGVTAAVAMTGRSAVASPDKVVASEAARKRGYRETPHIRTYYRKASL